MRPERDSKSRSSQLTVRMALMISTAMLFAGITGCSSIRRNRAEPVRGTTCDAASGRHSENDWFEQCQRPRSCRSSADCQGNCDPGCAECVCDLPRELKKVSFPDYIVEPPDTLHIDVRAGQQSLDAPIRSGERLDVRISSSMPGNLPRGARACRVQPDGTLLLSHGSLAIPVRGLTVPEARRMIELHLQQTDPGVHVALSRSTDGDDHRLSGTYPVRPDGTVSLAGFGPVYVAGLTVGSIRHSIERHLAGQIPDPQIQVDVHASDSKFFYVVTDHGDEGETVSRIPCTGNDTVLDALSQIKGLPAVAPERNVWIARPVPPEAGYEQILEVDWDAVVQGGQSRTNYQLLPGDRLYVQSDPSTQSRCEDGLLGNLFDKRRGRRRSAIERRFPPCDCSFGFFSSRWQPWGTCNTEHNQHFSSSTHPLSSGIQSEFHPGYSHSGPETGLENWLPSDSVTTSPHSLESIPGDGFSSSDDAAPILMTPQREVPGNIPPANPGAAPLQNQSKPFPRAIQSHPTLPNPQLPFIQSPDSTVPGTTKRSVSPIEPTFPAPRDSSAPSANRPIPGATTDEPSGTSSEVEPSGTGISLPPRRATSVTIDVPADSTGGSTLRLPGSDTAADRKSAASPDGRLPEASRSDSAPGDFIRSGELPTRSPVDSGIPETPEPSLRPQPPRPSPFVPGDSSAAGLRREAQLPQFGTGNFQPATHWQAVPKVRPSRQADWRIMPGFESRATSIPTTPERSSHRPLAPSDRVIFLAPPPQR